MRLAWIFRHLATYLIRSQQSYSILLKHFDRFREVRVRIGHGIDISWHLHPLCRSTHLVEGVIEAARHDDGDCVDLLRRNKPCMRLSARKKHAFSRCHWEDLTVNIRLHLTRKDIKELIFSRVNMRRWFSAPSHLTDNEVKRSVIIRGPRQLAMKHTFVPLRIG